MSQPTSLNVPRTLFLCALVMIVDGYDLSAMPLAVPHVVRAWGIEPSGFGIALSAVLLGLGAGAVLLGPLGDRLGRRPVIIAALLGIAVATLGTAASTSIGWFALWRLLTGLALGMCLPNVTALASEIAPQHRRAGLLTLVSCGIGVGGVGAGLLAPSLVALGGWHGLFVWPGGFTILLAALLFVWLPESPKFLAGASEPKRPRASPLLPLSKEFRFATFVFAGIYTVNALALYMLTGWIPTIVPQAGFSLAEAARFSSIVQGGGLVGGLLLSTMLDRGKAVLALGGAYCLVALALAAFSVVSPTALGWGTLLLIAGGGISGAHLAIMALGTGFYPPAVLSSAIGLAVAVARVGAIAGPLVGAQLIAAGIGPAGFFLAIVPAVLVCALAVLLIPRVRTAV